MRYMHIYMRGMCIISTVEYLAVGCYIEFQIQIAPIHVKHLFFIYIFIFNLYHSFTMYTYFVYIFFFNTGLSSLPVMPQPRRRTFGPFTKTERVKYM